MLDHDHEAKDLNENIQVKREKSKVNVIENQ